MDPNIIELDASNALMSINVNYHILLDNQDLDHATVVDQDRQVEDHIREVYPQVEEVLADVERIRPKSNQYGMGALILHHIYGVSGN